MSAFPLMNEELLAKWLEALRSDKYKQGQSRLRRRDNLLSSDTAYCCLGVLLDVAGAQWDPYDSCSYSAMYAGSTSAYMPDEIQAVTLGLAEQPEGTKWDGYAFFDKHDNVEHVDTDKIGKLAEINDTELVSFAEIADAIENDTIEALVIEAIARAERQEKQRIYSDDDE